MASVKKLNQIAQGLRAFGREISRAGQQPPPDAPKPRPKIGLALGGGFARGLAHIGVIKVMEEEGIPIDYIAGTSIGACIGAAYCSGVSAKELEEITVLLKFSHFARFSLSRVGLWNNDRLGTLLHKILKVKTFEELQIPLVITATDFVTGEPVVFNEGSLIEPDVTPFPYDCFHRCAELVKVGEEAARKMVPAMRGWFEGTELATQLKPAKAESSILVPNTVPVAS